MITVKSLMRRISQVMAAAALMPLAHAAPSASGQPLEGAIAGSVDGMALYQAHCAACHDGQVPRAPHVITFSTIGADTILNAMNNGVMRAQASALSASEREVLAGFLAGEAMAPPKPILACTDPMSELASADAAAMQGWGGNAKNHRHSDGAGLDRNNVDRLALKWVFAYPGALRARSQPLVHDGVIFVGSQSGDIYALDLESGCAHWTYSAGAEVRSSLSLGQVPGRDDPVLYMGDFSATVHAIDASDGSLIWRSSVGDHPDATITGSPKLHEGSLYVPISSSEWATAADPGYACCTFRGGVVSVDAASGEVNWRAHVIDEPAVETGETNPFGAARKGPSGAPVWNSPTIDAERGVLYVGTGEAYTSPAADTSDAVLAFSLATGERQWAKQLLGGDAWNMACFIGEAANCPEEDGPDLDIGASTVLWSGGERDYLLVGQKSGDVYALDPDKGVPLSGITRSVAAAFLGVSTGACQQMVTLCLCRSLTRRSPAVSPGRFLPGSMRSTPPRVRCGGIRPAWLTATVSRQSPSVIKACPRRLPALTSWSLPVASTATSMFTTASLARSSGRSTPSVTSNQYRVIPHWVAPSSLMAPCFTKGMC